MRPNGIGSLFLLFALLGLVPATAQQDSTGGDKVCDGQTFGHVLHIKYPSEGVTGCVGWNDGAGVCTYFDEWDGGRRGTPACHFEAKGNKLITERFPYAGEGTPKTTYPFKIVLRKVDLARDCFKKGGWWWGSKYSNEPVGPDEASVCK